MEHKDYDIVKKRLFAGLMFTALVGVLFTLVFLLPHYSTTGFNSGAAWAKESSTAESEPLIIVSMKTTMYEYVADDEDIDKMAHWIKEGSKNDTFFRNEIFPMMKNDCTSCHNTSSTMTDAAPEIPLSRYEDLKKYTSADS
jgi:hypothetical protein